MRLSRRRATAKAILNLADAFAAALVQPGTVGQMGLSAAAGGRLDPASTKISEVRVEQVDLLNNTITVSSDDPCDCPPGAAVRFAFAGPNGLYVGAGVIQDISRQESGVWEAGVWLPNLRLVEERQQVRVRIPGARATCRTGSRVFDCPVADVSARGMMLYNPGELPPGTPLQIRLHIPWLPPIDIQGVVVWNNVTRAGSSRAGVKFTRVAPSLQARLSKLCTFYHALLS